MLHEDWNIDSANVYYINRRTVCKKNTYNIAKYSGTTKVDLVENEEYGYCSLIKAASHVLEKMKIENVTNVKVTSTKRIEKNLVESVPLREALINAVVHNDFSREICQ